MKLVTLFVKVVLRSDFSAHIASKQSEERWRWETETEPFFEAWQKKNKDRVKKGLFTVPPPITKRSQTVDFF